MERWIRVASIDQLQQPGYGTCVTADGIGIALFLWRGRVHALENLCPHMGFPLADSTVHNGEVVCGWHGWHIDLSTGACRREKVTARVFPCEMRGDEVWIQMETLSTPNTP